jgi:uncharacterized membrane protein HdeD (DUF308 family)
MRNDIKLPMCLSRSVKSRPHVHARQHTAIIVLAVIGLSFLLAPAAAGGLLLQLIALALLAQSALQIVAALRVAPGEADQYAMLQVQAGVGATVGLLVGLRGWLVPTLDISAARTILGLGLLAYAIVGLAGAFLHRGEAESWYGPMVTAVLLIVLALVLLTSGESNAVDRITWLGWIALIGGVVLLFLAWRARGEAENG